MADFDLVSFYELIDHELLRSRLAKKVRSSEFLDLCSNVCAAGRIAPPAHTWGMAFRKGQSHRLSSRSASCSISTN